MRDENDGFISDVVADGKSLNGVFCIEVRPGWLYALICTVNAGSEYVNKIKAKSVIIDGDLVWGEACH